MTVAKLIEALSKFPQDYAVTIQDADDDSYDAIDGVSIQEIPPSQHPDYSWGYGGKPVGLSAGTPGLSHTGKYVSVVNLSI